MIDLVARLFNLSNYEAAQKLAHDFEIDPDKPPAAIALPKPERPLLRTYRQEEVRCLRVLCDYLHLLERWKVQYAPKTAADRADAQHLEEVSGGIYGNHRREQKAETGECSAGAVSEKSNPGKHFEAAGRCQAAAGLC